MIPPASAVQSAPSFGLVVHPGGPVTPVSPARGGRPASSPPPPAPTGSRGARRVPPPSLAEAPRHILKPECAVSRGAAAGTKKSGRFCRNGSSPAHSVRIARSLVGGASVAGSGGGARKARLRPRSRGRRGGAAGGGRPARSSSMPTGTARRRAGRGTRAAQRAVGCAFARVC